MTIVVCTLADAVERLNGTKAVSDLLTSRLGKPFSVSRISNWKKGTQPDRETYPVFNQALAEMDCIPDPAIWGLSARDFETALDTAACLRAFFPEIRQSVTPTSTMARLMAAPPLDTARASIAEPVKSRKSGRARAANRSFQGELAMTG